VVYRGFHLGLDHPIAGQVPQGARALYGRRSRLFWRAFVTRGGFSARMAEHPRSFACSTSASRRLRWAAPCLPRARVARGRRSRDAARLRGAAIRRSQALGLLRPAIDAMAWSRVRIAHRDLKQPIVPRADHARHRAQDPRFRNRKAMQDGEAFTQAATHTPAASALLPQYGAPEQFHSKRFGATGPWTDVHAFG